MELGRPLPVWRWAVVSCETEVLNSNSTSRVKETRQRSYLLHSESVKWVLEQGLKMFMERLSRLTTFGVSVFIV